ncbi:hypothetical protein [uncultured Rikenella sp.]|uniref:phage late control D family protein n=1 Tax=uncultured Rikenella sp. TaxID=368003 RepID=UPI00261A902D|nr:hypothetical protein [uncultured Rikenella sp.]
METGLKPKTVITYEGKDVSGDFAPILRGVTFKDFLDGRAGEIEIDLSNREGLFWADWYPDIDDEIHILMGYEGGDMLDTGIFWVDEVSLSGGGAEDACRIRALSLRSSGLGAPVQRRNHAGRAVADIVNEVAEMLGCRARGDLSGTWSGIQNETGLRFLNRLACELGRICKVEGTDLIFYPIQQLGQIGQLEIKRGDVIDYDVKDIAAGRLSKCTVKWWDRKSKKQISGTYDARIKGGGEAVRWEEVKSSSEARQKARDYIADRNKSGVEFSLTLLGDVRLRAGVGVRMSGFGRFDDLYYISEATHSDSSSGYTTRVTLQKPPAK